MAQEHLVVAAHAAALFDRTVPEGLDELEALLSDALRHLDPSGASPSNSTASSPTDENAPKMSKNSLKNSAGWIDLASESGSLAGFLLVNGTNMVQCQLSAHFRGASSYYPSSSSDHHSPSSALSPPGQSEGNGKSGIPTHEGLTVEIPVAQSTDTIHVGLAEGASLPIPQLQALRQAVVDALTRVQRATAWAPYAATLAKSGTPGAVLDPLQDLVEALEGIDLSLHTAEDELTITPPYGAQYYAQPLESIPSALMGTGRAPTPTSGPIPQSATSTTMPSPRPEMSFDGSELMPSTPGTDTGSKDAVAADGHDGDEDNPPPAIGKRGKTPSGSFGAFKKGGLVSTLRALSGTATSVPRHIFVLPDTADRALWTPALPHSMSLDIRLDRDQLRITLMVLSQNPVSAEKAPLALPVPVAPIASGVLFGASAGADGSTASSSSRSQSSVASAPVVQQTSRSSSSSQLPSSSDPTPTPAKTAADAELLAKSLAGLGVGSKYRRRSAWSGLGRSNVRAVKHAQLIRASAPGAGGLPRLATPAGRADIVGETVAWHGAWHTVQAFYETNAALPRLSSLLLTLRAARDRTRTMRDNASAVLYSL